MSGDLGPLTMYTNKRRRHVFFTKLRPDRPPSQRQLSKRNRFRRIGEAWQRQSQESRDRWDSISRCCRLRCSGYGLFLWWHTRHDRGAMQTLIRNSGIKPDL